MFGKVSQVIIWKTQIYGYVYDFSDNDDSIDVADSFVIRKHVIVNDNIK